jgi:hypothetical protein
MKKIRVGFLFNHYFPHQVPHAAPYAFELSRLYGDLFEVIIACSTKDELAFARRIGELYPGHNCQYFKLKVPLSYRILDPFLSTWVFGRKKVVLKHNLGFFRSLKALVVPEKTSLALKTQFHLRDLIMIHTRHGAGDRPGSFDDRSRFFDFTLLPGQKYVDRLKELGFLEEGKYAVVGWPKFEVVEKLHPVRPRLFDNDNVTVVYNPHFDQRLASWGAWGEEVLDFFIHHPEYNLIFAPHVVLFKRRFRHGAHSIPRRFYRAKNLLIDLGSLASVDMTYMLAADIYLGDVSSQVYEFLWKPRPCIFLNPHRVPWEGNPYYFHWTLGQVVNHVETELGPALAKAFKVQPHYLPKQIKAFHYTFHQEAGSTAAERGARAIAGFLIKRLGL